MLHKSFKSAKCKTSLKLASSRIKLLKNKKEVQIKQLRREVAQLLESGQVQTAKIRVEHVVREEKTMGAYELIEIYCELIAARLPIIESQKNCPIDLKEAIASVAFASPRCADITELMDVRKHFMVKYGKDFISAAVELRPDCGVNRSLIEKLSAKTPDGATKLKMLTMIAEEHNIKWDPNSFGGNDGPSQDDLLKGSSTFVKASRMYIESPNVHTSSSVDVGSQKAAKEEDLRNSHARTSSSRQSSERVSSVNSHLQTPFSANVRKPEARRGRYSGDASMSYVGRPDWNMEFADATAAAQAAAESAERASMAARAAAELSSRGTATVHYAPDRHGFRDEVPERPSGLRPPGEDLSRTQVNDASVGRKSRMPDGQIGRREENPARDYDSQNDPRKSASFKSNPDIGSTYHGGPVRGVINADNAVRGGATDTHSNEGDSSDDNDSLSGMTKKLYQDAYKKSSDSKSSDFRTSAGGADVPVYKQQAAGKFTETNPLSTELDNDGMSHKGSIRKNSFEEVNIISTSNDIHARKNSGESLEEYTLEMQNSPESPTLHSSSFMEKHRLPPLDDGKAEDGLTENPFANEEEEIISAYNKTSDGGAVVFDDYGSDEDAESVFDLDKGPKVSHTSSLPHIEAHQLEDAVIASPGRIMADSFKMSIAEAVPESRAAPDTEENLPVTFDDSDDLSSENEAEPEKLSSPKESRHGSGVQISPGLPDFVPVSEVDIISESENRLAFGNLTGGRRNKSCIPPPYMGATPEEDSLLNQRRHDRGFSSYSSTSTDKVSNEDAEIHYSGNQLEGFPSRSERKNDISHEVTVPQAKTGSHPVVYVDGEEEFELEPNYWKKPSTRPLANSVEKKRLSSRNSRQSHTDVRSDTAEEPSSGKSRVGTTAGLSRRTKAGTSRDASAGENSANLRASAEKDNPVSEPVKAYGKEDTENSTVARPKAGLDSASREDSLTQASHVHPKMPQDYESLLANLQSLRANRQ